MGKTKDKAQELLDRTNAILDEHYEGKSRVHNDALRGLLGAVVVLEDLLDQDETGLTYTKVLELWEKELTIKEVNGL